MTVNNTEEPNRPPQPEDDEINLLEYLLVIVKHKKLIFITCVVTFILTCGITLQLPNIYLSTARILPPQERQSSISSMIGGLGGLAALAGVSVEGGSSLLYVSMLKSRTISDAIIQRFDLMTLNGWSSRFIAYKALDRMVTVGFGKDGVIAISVENKDPELASKIANAYVEELKNLNVSLNLNSAGRERLFLENRLALVKSDLTKAEDLLKDFQEKNKAIRIDAQANAIIDAIAKLKGELASKEVELGVLISSQTEQNPQVIALREGISQIKTQISRLERSPDSKDVSRDIFLATSEVPELGIQYARLLRNFKIQETLFELLTKQYEIAKINEAKNTSTLQILDEAVAADRKSKPKRSLIVILVTFAAVFFAVLYSFIKEYRKRMSSEDRKLWGEIRQQLKFGPKPID